jgi:metal-responsive CopG/Arc/MetJ family transcriptional regulator
METETINQNINLNIGKLAVDLHLEDRVLANGVLSKKGLHERSAIVTGIIHHLLERNEWRRALQLRFKENTTRLLYDRNEEEFNAKLLQSIHAKDFRVSKDGTECGYLERDEDLDILVQKAGQGFVRNMLAREDLPMPVLEYLINQARDTLGEQEWKESLSALGKRVQKEYPLKAYAIFRRAEDKEAIRELYEQFEKKFKLEDIEFLITMAGHNDDRDTRLKGIVTKAIPLLGRKKSDKQKLGLMLYRVVKDRGLVLSAQDTEQLEKLAVKGISRYDLESTADRYKPNSYQNLKLQWAKTHWESEPIEAYKIFMGSEYDGKEVVPCAQKAFSTMNPEKGEYKGDKTTIKKEHLEVIFKRMPETDYRSRELVARILEYKDEFLRLGKIHAKSHEKDCQINAYRLLTAGGMGFDDPLVDKIRRELIATEFEKARKESYGWPSFFWLDRNDHLGYEQAYDVYLNGIGNISWLSRAYELAAGKGDIKRVEQARKEILGKTNLTDSIRFFKEAGDRIGYDVALDALAKRYEVPAAEVQTLLDLEKNSK